MNIKITVPTTKKVTIKPKFNVGDTIKVEYNENTFWISNIISIEIYKDWSISYLIPTGENNMWFNESKCSSI